MAVEVLVLGGVALVGSGWLLCFSTAAWCIEYTASTLDWIAEWGTA